MSEIDEMFFKEGTSLDGAIPGESLTVSPDDPRPWESPPQIVTKSDGLEYYFDLLTSEEIYDRLMDSLESGVTVMDIVKTFLYQGFQEGLFNPDMMLILAEPLAYMIAALAERAQIEFVIQDDEDDDEEDVSMFGQAVGTIEEPEPGEEFPDRVTERLEDDQPMRAESLLGAR